MDTVFKYKLPIFEYQVYGNATTTIDWLLNNYNEEDLARYLTSWADTKLSVVPKKIAMLKAQIAKEINNLTQAKAVQEKQQEVTMLCILNTFKELTLRYMRKMLVDLRDSSVWTRNEINEIITNDEDLRKLYLSVMVCGKINHELMDNIYSELKMYTKMVACSILNNIVKKKGTISINKVVQLELYSNSTETLAICTREEYFSSLKHKIEAWRTATILYEGYLTDVRYKTTDTVFSPTLSNVIRSIHFKYQDIISLECARLAKEKKLNPNMRELVDLVLKHGPIRTVELLHSLVIVDLRTQLIADCYLKLYREIKQRSRIMIANPELTDNKNFKGTIVFNGKIFEFEADIRPYLWNEVEVVKSEV